MSEEHRMSIEFNGTLESDDVEGFEIDPLGELTPFERGIHRFAHNHDRHIRIRIGKDSTVVEAFRDVVPFFFELLENVAGLASGKPFCLELPELGQSVGFSIATDETVCCDLRGSTTPGPSRSTPFPKRMLSAPSQGSSLSFFAKLSVLAASLSRMPPPSSHHWAA